MAWYKKYLSVYEMPYGKVHEQVAKKVRNKLGEIAVPDPEVSVIAIAHHEEQHV